MDQSSGRSGMPVSGRKTGNPIITVHHALPDFPNREAKEKRKKEIAKILYQIYSKYKNEP